jgi:hypothetical protein
MTIDDPAPSPRATHLESPHPTGGYDQILAWPNGNVSYLRNRELHRDDGPAFLGADGSRSWHRNGREHREDGPAVECPDGPDEWWLDGRQVSESEFRARGGR